MSYCNTVSQEYNYHAHNLFQDQDKHTFLFSLLILHATEEGILISNF